MASTRYYLDYLNDQIDISPANSQEELDAAQLLQSLMDEHGLDTTMQEFDAPAGGEFTHDLTCVLLFFGMVMSGVLDSAVGVVGRVIVLVCVALLALRFGGYDLLGGIGPKARSQNVIGVHRATGPLVVKGNRPIVIVAHYDSPNENPLYRRNFVSLLPVIKRMSLWLVILVSLCTLLQLIGAIPEVGRHVFWGIGIVAGIPLIVIGVANIYERFAPCTVGASDNKSSVAALLGVMDMVRPADDDAKRQAAVNLRSEVERGVAAGQVPEDEADGLGELGEGSQVEEAHVAPKDVGQADGEGVKGGEEDGSVTEGSPAMRETEGEAPDAEALSHESSDRDEDSQEPDQDPRIGSLSGVFDRVRKGTGGLFGRIRSAAVKEPEPIEDDRYGFAPEPPSVVATPRVPAMEKGVGADDDTIGASISTRVPGEGIEANIYRQNGDGSKFDPDTIVANTAPSAGDTETAETLEVPIVSKPEPRPVTSNATRRERRVPKTRASSTSEPQAVAQANEHDVVRRGASFIESLQILPSDCEIVYEMPPRPKVDLSKLPEVPEIPDFKVEDFYVPVESVDEEEPQEEHTGSVPTFFSDRERKVKARRDTAARTEAAESRSSAAGTDDASYEPGSDDIYADYGEGGEDAAYARNARDTLENTADAEYESMGTGGRGGLADLSQRVVDILAKIREAFRSLVERITNRKKTISGSTAQYGMIADEQDEDDQDPDDFYYDDDSQEPQQEGVEDDDVAIEGEYVVEDDVQYDSDGSEDDTKAFARDEMRVDASVLEDEDDAEGELGDTQPDGALPRFDDADTTGGLVEGDMSGLDTKDEDVRPDERKRPRPVDDPRWGTSDFRPAPVDDGDPSGGVAHRAVLFDLPDPSLMPKDPLAPDDLGSATSYDSGQTSASVRPVRGTREPIGIVRPSRDFGAEAGEGSQVRERYARTTRDRGGESGYSGGSRRSQAADDGSASEWSRADVGHDAGQDGRTIGSRDRRSGGRVDGDRPASAGSRPDTRRWKGGATERYDLRVVDERVREGEWDDAQQQRPTKEDLREAILGMGDDELISHDVWFVALGASSIRHAGMREFLADFRKSVRGAFVVNLDSIGAGDLTILTSEGANETRRSDRRLVRLLGSVAKDLHVNVNRRRYIWTETDATPAMHASMRAATLMGLSHDGVPELSHTVDDVPENVDAEQVVSVTELVSELIRRS
jgi:hypothetical protein